MTTTNTPTDEQESAARSWMYDLFDSRERQMCENGSGCTKEQCTGATLAIMILAPHVAAAIAAAGKVDAESLRQVREQLASAQYMVGAMIQAFQRAGLTEFDVKEVDANLQALVRRTAERCAQMLDSMALGLEVASRNNGGNGSFYGDHYAGRAEALRQASAEITREFSLADTGRGADAGAQEKA